MLRTIRWSSLAVVCGAGILAVFCLVVALRGRRTALLPAVVCLGVVIREIRTLRRRDAARNHPGYQDDRPGPDMRR